MISTHPPACRHFETPLEMAIDRNRRDVCELLIAGKADVDAKNGCAFIF